MGFYPIPLPKDSASLSLTAKPSHRAAPHRRADQLHERVCGPSAQRRRVAGSGAQALAGASEGLIYKGKDAAANRGGLPTFTGLVFLRQRYNPQWLSRQPPKLHRESHGVSRA